MRAVIQRCSRAELWVEGRSESEAAIERGLVVFVGVQSGDGPKDIEYVVRKTVSLRIFEDETGRMNVSAKDLGLPLFVVSQFTLLGDVRHGCRPDFTRAGRPDDARGVYDKVLGAFRATGLPVYTGQFQAHMDVLLVNDGPVTILIDSRKEF